LIKFNQKKTKSLSKNGKEDLSKVLKQKSFEKKLSTKILVEKFDKKFIRKTKQKIINNISTKTL
jgi:hypothetical protein